ncbi:MAG: hypothetical protein ACLRWQ_21650 [Flavonifractor plautii]
MWLVKAEMTPEPVRRAPRACGWAELALVAGAGGRRRRTGGLRFCPAPAGRWSASTCGRAPATLLRRAAGEDMAPPARQGDQPAPGGGPGWTALTLETGETLSPSWRAVCRPTRRRGYVEG